MEPDGQFSLVGPDMRLMKARGIGIVGCNTQTAVDPTNCLIIASDVTHNGGDKSQLYPMACTDKIVADNCIIP